MSKDLYILAKADRQYRSSHLAGLNPRSKTEVKPGAASAVRRLGRTAGAGMVGGVAGKYIGAAPGILAKKPGLARVGAKGGATGGGIGAGTWGKTQNIKSGDVRATHRATGKKALGAAYGDASGFGFWRYNKRRGEK